MTDELAALQQRLLQGYQEQVRHYDRAINILAQHPRWETLLANNDWVHDLDAVLKQVTGLDAAMRDDKAAWLRSEQSPGAELSALLGRLAESIRTLADGVNALVGDVKARKEELLPEIDEFIQKRRMLQAYGKYGDRPSHVATSF
jgi:hypothetical protein